MRKFDTAREAKEYLIGRILAQAEKDGVPLSDVERKMLYFSETGWTLPDMMAVSREFDQSYDQDQYETTIGELLWRVEDQPDGDREGWDEAVRRLRDEDHYLSVLIDQASRGKASRWDTVKAILAGVAVVAVFLPMSFFVYDHVQNSTLSNLIVGGGLLGLVLLAAYVGSR